MNESKKTKSISKKINREHVLDMLSSFILINIILLLLFTAFWCYDTETSSGEKFRLRTSRSVTSIQNLSKEKYAAISDIQTEKNNLPQYKKYIFPKKMLDFFSGIVYVYEDSTGNIQYRYMGKALIDITLAYYAIWIFQILSLIKKIFGGSRVIRSKLAPLDEIAFKTNVLGAAADFDIQAFEELEKAINEISPSKEGARLHTGNSELEHLESSINNLLDRMRESYRQQSRFVSDASHELRTPLSVLQGYVNMLDRWGKTDEKILDESIEAIKSETEHMKKLVEQLLFLARGDSGKTKLNMENFSLNKIMKEVYDESSMIDPNHLYYFKPSPSSITACGDISMLKQTARILIDNAAKYAPENSSIIISTDTDKNNSPVFTIQDEGIGISAEDAAHMFDRFFRSDPARGKDNGGTGLGLSIAKWIIDRHGGYFDVISREDIGTRINVCIPNNHN